MFRSTQLQAANLVACNNLQSFASQTERHVKTARFSANDITNINLASCRSDFEPPLAERAPRGEHAKDGIGEFITGIEQIKCRQFSAAQRAA